MADEKKSNPDSSAVPSSQPALAAPDALERRAIEDAVKRRANRRLRFQIRFKQTDGGAVAETGAEHTDHEGWLARLDDAFGTHGRAFAATQLDKLVQWCQGKDGVVDAVMLNGMLAVVEGTKSDNEIQAMLVVQMAVTHTAAQQALRRVTRVDQIAQVDSAGSLAVKLLRTFTMLAETLDKLQRGGEQVVKVVHVHPGGQAIVGNVVSGASGGASTLGGGGAPMKTETNPMQRPNRQPQALSRCRKCGAKTRRGTPCASPAVARKARCRMHGGASGSGAPRDARNGAYRFGLFTEDAIAARRELSAILGQARATLNEIG